MNGDCGAREEVSPPEPQGGEEESVLLSPVGNYHLSSEDEDIDENSTTFAVAEGIEKALNQNSQFWMVNATADLDDEDEIKRHTLRGIDNTIEKAGGMPQHAPLALQLLQQFDLLEQKGLQSIAYHSQENLAIVANMGEEKTLEEIKRTAEECNFVSDVDNIILQNTQSAVLHKLRQRLRSLEEKQKKVVNSVLIDTEIRRDKLHQEVRHILPHVRNLRDFVTGDAPSSPAPSSPPLASDIPSTPRSECSSSFETTLPLSPVLLDDADFSRTDVDERIGDYYAYTEELKAEASVAFSVNQDEQSPPVRQRTRAGSGGRGLRMKSETERPPLLWAKLPWCILGLVLVSKFTPDGMNVALAAAAMRRARKKGVGLTRGLLRIPCRLFLRGVAWPFFAAHSIVYKKSHQGAIASPLTLPFVTAEVYDIVRG